MSDDWAQAPDAPAPLNVLVVGDTGVGKSSLINAVLDQEVADAGVGAPVTQHPAYYLSADGFLGLWDFPGFEHGTKATPTQLLTRGLKEIGKAGPAKAVDVAWFCWDASSARVTESQRALVRTLEDKDIPVIAVLTKTTTSGGHLKAEHLWFAQWIASQRITGANPNVYPTTSVLDEMVASPLYGLNELVAASAALRR